ncbi:hypothetical protein Thimo_2883 [Thioflavicoccus mobilis 8321]|uniref:TIR domain-containing protein n=1 Tax=Thioflavicoccus mobilis 8321 TaxID=765912 RepID=L0GXV3_9GAMM|nr:SUMF1/EgtB/PvdO family nonheme iron enzyme [Thioflavicoccus mobilis]AGA91583.1 hypothetical protein Thimo_2883 [Thioflavicoccus mobilis 8321]
MTEPSPVFLSYSRNDLQAAEHLHAQLEQSGVSVFKDDASIREGDQWLTRLQDAVVGCSGFVVLIGRDGVSRWIGAETQVALIRYFGPHDETERLPIFPVLLGAVRSDSLPAFLQLFQVTTWDGQAALAPTLLEQIRRRRLVASAEVPFEGCPYVGLDAFRTDQARLFFGRQKETLEALACFDTRPGRPTVRWLEISGNSGSGKSSLMNAGLLPLIDQGWLWPRTGIAHWLRIGPWMPGQHPIGMLAESLTRFAREALEEPAEMAQVRTLLEKNDSGLADWLRGRKRDDSAFLLAIDQFEELFTFADERERRSLDRLLATALADDDCPLFLISTVRADFLDRFGEQLPALAGMRNRRGKDWLLPPIGGEGLREVIEGPARLAGLTVSEVCDAIINDARNEPGALPLVENALHWLWERRDGARLSGRVYFDQGQLAGILSRNADDLLDSLGRNGRQAALELLFELVKVDPESRQHTRRRIAREEAERSAGGGQQGRDLVDILSGCRNLEVPHTTGSLRLITVTEEGANGQGPVQSHSWINLIHETLIRTKGLDPEGRPQPYWPTLWDYIEANKERGPERERLERLALDWKDRSGLARLSGLAGGRDRKRWKRLSVKGSREAERFLAWSRWTSHVQIALLVLLAAVVGESFLWTRVNDLPVDSMVLQQRFRLGYAPLPELVGIPPGAFAMGEQDAAFVQRVPDEYRSNVGIPGKSLEIAEAFDLGKYEVTYDELDFYVWEQHRLGHYDVKYPTTAKGGRGRRPVVNISWLEANAYADWLGRRLGRACRLPTEAEWEYAARANSSTGYPWGDEVTLTAQGTEVVMANCRDCGSPWDSEESAPVGSFPENAFGLHDTSGNVWEWTCSLWRDAFDGSEAHCAEAQDSDRRVVRGGSWLVNRSLARSAARLRLAPDDRLSVLGFRVLCASPIPGH